MSSAFRWHGVVLDAPIATASSIDAPANHACDPTKNCTDSKVKPQAAGSNPKLQMSLGHDVENNGIVSDLVPIASNGERPSKARENDAFIKSLVTVSKNNSKDSELVA